MIIDVNVHLDRWPFRRLPCDEISKLLAKLGSHGVQQAWAGSYDGLLHEDIAGVNSRLAEACRDHRPGTLVPFGSVNPTLPDWAEDVRRCREDYRMPGIRLHPNYHGYQLDDPTFAELLALAEERDLIVQLVVRMEDVRTQHPLMQVPDVDLTPLVALIKKRPSLRLVLLNALRTTPGALVAQLAASGNVYFEIAMLEGVGGIGKVLRGLPLERLLFGSHMPLFHLESAILKLQESDLTEAQRDAITQKNARRILAG